MTPLHFACNQGNFAVVRALVESGANLMARNWVGDTPLELACNSKVATLELLEYLLQHDAYSADQQSPWCGPTLIYYLVVYGSTAQAFVLGDKATTFTRVFSRSTWHK